MTRPDRRRERTRRALSDALIALILERGYDNIRPDDIAERADLARATFYLHFDNKNDLLLQTLEDVYDELVIQIRERSPAQTMNADDTAIRIVFRHAAENRQLYRVMLKSQAATIITDRLRTYLAARVAEQIDAVIPAHIRAADALPMPVVAHYVAGSLLGVIMWWLEQETMPDANVMATMFQRMNTVAIAAGFGVTLPSEDGQPLIQS